MQLAAGLGGAYERLRLPAGMEQTGVSYEEIDLTTTLGSGRPLHERVVDALRSHVFDSMDPSRVARIGRLDRSEFAWCERIADDAFRYFEFPKLWTVEPIRDAIARGVAAGAFGYAFGASEEDSKLVVSQPGALRLRTQMRADEVDLGPGTAIVTLALAARIVPAESPDSPEPPPPDGGDTPPGAGTPPGPPPAVRSRVRLEIHATEDDLHTLSRALSSLRELVKPGTLRISLAVDADAGEAEIDRVRYANNVLEPLEEDPDITFTEDWEDR